MLKIEIPQISAVYTGSGDLYAALFLAHSYLQKNLKLALENTINSLHDVLLTTYDYSQGKTLMMCMYVQVH
jgi:pyridoxine kinase